MQRLHSSRMYLRITHITVSTASISRTPRAAARVPEHPHLRRRPCALSGRGPCDDPARGGHAGGHAPLPPRARVPERATRTPLRESGHLPGGGRDVRTAARWARHTAPAATLEDAAQKKLRNLERRCCSSGGSIYDYESLSSSSSTTSTFNQRLANRDSNVPCARESDLPKRTVTAPDSDADCPHALSVEYSSFATIIA